MTKTVRNIAPAPKPQATEARLTEKLVLEVHRNEVWEVCFSHDGTKLASSGAEKIAIIYDVDNAFSILNRLEGHGAGIAAVAWSPNDTKLVTCSQDFTAKMWDTETGECLHTLKDFRQPVTGCMWIDDNHFITTSLDGSMSICSWSFGRFPMRLVNKYTLGTPLTPILGGVILPDTNKILTFDHKKNFYTHDLEDGDNTGRQSTAETELTSMCVSKIGKPYVLVVRKDGLIEMLDSKTVQPVKVFKMKRCGEYVIKATFGGENEEFVACGSEDGDVYVWGTETGTLLAKTKIHGRKRSTCNSVAWNPKRHDMLATAGDDGLIKILTINSKDEGEILPPRTKWPVRINSPDSTGS